MPISSNARSARDKQAAKALISTLSRRVGKSLIHVDFDSDTVTVADVEMQRPDFEAWADAGFPWEDGPNLGEDEERSGPRRRVEASPPTPPTPVEEDEDEIEDPDPDDIEDLEASDDEDDSDDDGPDTDTVLDDLVAEAFQIEEHERSGKHGSNVARFKRGELMVRLRDISVATKVPVKDLLTHLNQRSLALASEHSVPDFGIITEQEATTTRKVVSAFGSSGEFRHLAGLDPATGAPLVTDDGEPIVLPLTEVAMNKLYPLAEFADEIDQDELLSFAHAHTEKVVKAAKRVTKRTDRPFQEVMGHVNGLRARVESPLGIGEVEVYPSEKDITASLREMAGEAPEPDIASLKTSRGWYDGTWLPIKALVDAVARAFMPTAVNQTSNATSNVFVLERLMTQYFAAYEDEGVQRILGALVTSGDLTAEQADEFINSFALDPETDEWVRVRGDVSDEDAASVDESTADVEADDESTETEGAAMFDDSGLSDDIDIDTPEGPAEADDEDEADDDF